MSRSPPRVSPHPTFQLWLERQNTLGKGTVIIYTRIGARIEREYGGNPTAFLHATLPGAKQGTADSYRGAAARYAAFRGLVAQQPAIRKFETGQERQPLSPDELTAYYNAVDLRVGPPHKVVLQLLPRTGLRISEAVGMKVEHIKQAGSVWGFRFPGKGEKWRFVPLTPQAHAILYAHLQAARNPHNPYLFQEPGTRLAITAQSVREVLRTIRDGLPGGAATVTPHVLRHTWATNMVEGGVDTRIIQEILGHEDIRTTQRYEHPTAAGMARAMGKVEEGDD